MSSPNVPAARAERRDNPPPAVVDALGWDGPVKRPAGGPAGSIPARELLTAYLQEQFDELLRQQRRVQAEEPDGIHRMRVSTRRLRSALASYRALLAPEPARTLRSELKWLAQVLGAARDASVMRHRLQDLVASQPPELVLGPVSARIDEELLSDYTAALRIVRQELEGERYRSAVDGLRTLIAESAWTAEADGSGGDTAEAMIRRDLGRLRSRIRTAKAEKDRDARAEILHEARKDAKRLRYAAETWRPAGGQAAESMVEAAEGLQKILGEHQDSVVTRELLRRMGSATGPGESGFTYGRLHAIEEQRAKDAEKQFRRLWKRFPGSP
jgi:CHAD domain-containing protein